MSGLQVHNELVTNADGNPVCPCGERLPYTLGWSGEMYCTECRRVWKIRREVHVPATLELVRQIPGTPPFPRTQRQVRAKVLKRQIQAERPEGI